MFRAKVKGLDLVQIEDLEIESGSVLDEQGVEILSEKDNQTLFHADELDLQKSIDDVYGSSMIDIFDDLEAAGTARNGEIRLKAYINALETNSPVFENSCFMDEPGSYEEDPKMNYAEAHTILGHKDLFFQTDEQIHGSPMRRLTDEEIHMRIENHGKMVIQQNLEVDSAIRYNTNTRVSWKSYDSNRRNYEITQEQKEHLIGPKLSVDLLEDRIKILSSRPHMSSSQLAEYTDLVSRHKITGEITDSKLRELKFTREGMTKAKAKASAVRGPVKSLMVTQGENTSLMITQGENPLLMITQGENTSIGSVRTRASRPSPPGIISTRFLAGKFTSNFPRRNPVVSQTTQTIRGPIITPVTSRFIVSGIFGITVIAIVGGACFDFFKNQNLKNQQSKNEDLDKDVIISF